METSYFHASEVAQSGEKWVAGLYKNYRATMLKLQKFAIQVWQLNCAFLSHIVSLKCTAKFVDPSYILNILYG